MARIKIANQYGPGEAADDIFRAFLMYSANARLSMAKDEQQYFANLSRLVGESAQYNGSLLDENDPNSMTDWQYLEYEIGEATSIYCNGDIKNCYGDAMGEPQGQLVGILNTAFRKNKMIWDNTQDWIEKYAGTDGWMDKIEKYQKSYTGKDGTKGATDILSEIANYRKEKDGAFRQTVVAEQNETLEELNNWVRQAAYTGLMDMTPGDPLLDYIVAPYDSGIDPKIGPDGMPTNPEFIEHVKEYQKNAHLTAAIELLKMGQTEPSKVEHNKWIAEIEQRGKDQIADMQQEEQDRVDWVNDAIAEKNKVQLQYDKDIDTQIGFLKTNELNVKSDSGSMVFDPEFKESIQSYITGTEFEVGSINIDNVGGAKRLIARNLAKWMDEYSRGDTNASWVTAYNNVAKINDGLPDDKKLAHGDLNVMAVNAFFGPMSDTDVGSMVQGKLTPLLPFGIGGTGMDFPGTFDKEDRAQEYMLQTYKVWSLMNEMEHDDALRVDISAGTTPSTATSQDPGGFLTVNKNQYINTLPQDTSNVSPPPIISNPIDSLLQQQNDSTWTGAYNPNDKQQAAMMRGMEKFHDWNQVVAHRKMIINHLDEDPMVPRPEAVWQEYYSNYLDSMSVYESLEDYLKAGE